MPRAARSFSPAAAIHEAVDADPESRDHGLHLTQQKYVAARRTRRERARGVRPFGSRHFSTRKCLHFRVFCFFSFSYLRQKYPKTACFGCSMFFGAKIQIIRIFKINCDFLVIHILRFFDVFHIFKPKNSQNCSYQQ